MLETILIDRDGLFLQLLSSTGIRDEVGGTVVLELCKV